MACFKFDMWPDKDWKISLGEILDALPPNDLQWLMTEFEGSVLRAAGLPDYARFIDEANSPEKLGKWFSWSELNEFANAIGGTDWCTLIATPTRDDLAIHFPIAVDELAQHPTSDYFAEAFLPLCPAADCVIEGFDSTTWLVALSERFNPTFTFDSSNIRRRTTTTAGID